MKTKQNDCNMNNTITTVDISLPKQKSVYKGKVRDVINIDDDLLVMIVTDRISCFDVVLLNGIPYKGQVLNLLAAKFLEDTIDIIPNWMIAVPDPNVMIGYKCVPFKVEMIVRGYLSGHAWREYKTGKRALCGVKLPDNLNENDKLPAPIITPTTKADVGHDEDISRENILKQGLVSEEDYRLLESYSLALFERGARLAAEKGLILVDTKYEFGKYRDNDIYLIDEIHTPDSSRYFYADGYPERQNKGEPQKQLSKEFARQWLIENGFQGKDGQQIPEMGESFISSVSERYIELFENLTGEPFIRTEVSDISQRIENNINQFFITKQQTTI